LLEAAMDDGSIDNGMLHPLDAMSVSRDHHTVLLENETVRVLDTRLGPGERTPVHTHQWPAVFYVLSWSEFIRYDPDGTELMDSRSLPSEPEIGAAFWGAPLVPHYVRNVGDRDLHIIATELKRA
jgi:mannose-6-phosphate isomerase-like protein (cupin superfamily)